jgi:hypothetical protein
MATYGIVKKTSLPYGQALSRTREALKAEGFGVITEIDVQRTVKEKLGEGFRPYIILRCMQSTAGLPGHLRRTGNRPADALQCLRLGQPGRYEYRGSD